MSCIVISLCRCWLSYAQSGRANTEPQRPLFCRLQETVDPRVLWETSDVAAAESMGAVTTTFTAFA
jgi:hypothetical protein